MLLVVKGNNLDSAQVGVPLLHRSSAGQRALPHVSAQCDYQSVRAAADSYGNNALSGTGTYAVVGEYVEGAQLLRRQRCGP